MKLLNLNISIKISNSKDVAKFLIDQNADIVTLQEVLRHFNNEVFEQYQSKKDIELEVRKIYPNQFFAPIWVSEAIKRGEEMRRDFGGLVEQGNEILSKYTILNGTNEFFYKHFSYAKDWSNWDNEDHGRSVQITELSIDGKILQIFNIHGIWTKNKLGDARTIKECRYLIDVAKKKKLPTIVVGDFNLLPESKSIKLMNRHFRNLINECNIKSTRPNFDDGRDQGNLVVDYILVSKEIEVKNFNVTKTPISDHLPLIIEFELK